MKNLTVLLILSFALSLAFFSCKKDNNKNSADSYYIKGKKDGVAFNFTTNAIAKIASLTPGSGSSTLDMLANGNSLEALDISFAFYNNITASTGSYTSGVSSPNYVINGVYHPDNTTTLYGTENWSPSVNPLMVHITSKTSTEITGTFEGAFYKGDTMSGSVYNDYILVTDGEFKLQIK